MYIIEKEIMTQHEALALTAQYMRGKKDYVNEIFESGYDKMVFIGCGSSYMLARSAAMLFTMRTPMKAVALAGGDYLVSPQSYASLLEDALVVVITRSGETSEINYAVDLIKAAGNAGILCIHAKNGSTVAKKCAWELCVDWAFDHSVCQTRTISNFYMALTWLYAIYAGSYALMDDLDAAALANEAFKLNTRAALTALGEGEWENAIVLADGELCGLAQEGALAFNEICIKRGEYFNFLDYRHGPMVLLRPQTLVIAVVRGEGLNYQYAMLSDLKARGATVVTVSALKSMPVGDAHIQIPPGDYAAWGISMIYVPQMIAYARAIRDGHNPDEPDGLDSYITL